MPRKKPEVGMTIEYDGRKGVVTQLLASMCHVQDEDSQFGFYVSYTNPWREVKGENND